MAAGDEQPIGKGTARPAPGRSRFGRPPITSRANILATARAIIERDGWEKLTIRKLAGELGVGASTVYHHVRDRQDLLIQLLNDHAAGVAHPHVPVEPHARIVTVAVAMRDTLAAWPWAADVLTADGFVGLLDASALWSVETIVATAQQAGCTPHEAADLFRHIWYYTVGEILVRAHSRERPPIHPGEPGTPFLRNLDPATMPGLAAIGDDWPTLAARDTFAEGVSALVHRFVPRSGAGI